MLFVSKLQFSNLLLTLLSLGKNNLGILINLECSNFKRYHIFLRVLGITIFFNYPNELFFFLTVKNVETGRSAPGVKMFFGHEILNGESFMFPEYWYWNLQ
jgi:hypothetical protein